MQGQKKTMRYVVYQGADLPRIAGQLLMDKIFVEDGDLQRVWARIERTGTNMGRKCLVVLAQEMIGTDNSDGDTYSICGALLYEINRSQIQVYVKPKFRRKGYGSAMLERLRDYENYDSRVISATPGYRGSNQFFEKNLVFVPYASLDETEAPKVAGGKSANSLPLSGESMREIEKRRKREFLGKVLKAKRDGLI